MIGSNLFNDVHYLLLKNDIYPAKMDEIKINNNKMYNKGLKIRIYFKRRIYLKIVLDDIDLYKFCRLFKMIDLNIKYNTIFIRKMKSKNNYKILKQDNIII